MMSLGDDSTLVVQWVVAIGAALAAAICDLRTRRIPNWLTMPVLLCGLTWAAWVAGWRGLGSALAGCLLLASPYVLLFAFAGGGAGDAKLMGALGSWLGVAHGAVALVSVLAAGAVLGIAFASASKRLGAVLANLSRIVSSAVITVLSGSAPSGAQRRQRGVTETQTMPYGIAVFIGVCVAAGAIFAWRTWY